MCPSSTPWQTPRSSGSAASHTFAHSPSRPVGVGLIRAAYSDVRFRSGLGEMGNLILGRTNGGDASASKFALGYVHNLSKRTALYATASWTRIRDGQYNPAVMGINAGGPSGSLPTGSVNGFRSTGNGVAGYAPRSAAGYDFGIRHAFSGGGRCRACGALSQPRRASARHQRCRERVHFKTRSGSRTERRTFATAPP
ncbi:porin [Variovorax brevis]|uniref:porin n=1 Tax=Variovorax brevis TaxID=3053503 RepID=UPI0033655A77